MNPIIKFAMLDGTVVSVEGPGAQTVANLISTKLNLTSNSSLVTGSLESPEEVLPLPSMNFAKSGKAPKVVINQDLADDETEEVLQIPKMSFAK